MGECAIAAKSCTDDDDWREWWAAQTKGLDVGTRVVSVVYVETTACDNRLRMRRQTFRMRRGDQPGKGRQGRSRGILYWSTVVL